MTPRRENNITKTCINLLLYKTNLKSLYFSDVPVQAFPAVTTEKERSQSRQNLSSTFETWTPGGVGKDVLFILDKLRAKQQLP